MQGNHHTHQLNVPRQHTLMASSILALYWVADNSNRLFNVSFSNNTPSCMSTGAGAASGALGVDWGAGAAFTMVDATTAAADGLTWINTCKRSGLTRSQQRSPRCSVVALTAATEPHALALTGLGAADAGPPSVGNDSSLMTGAATGFDQDEVDADADGPAASFAASRSRHDDLPPGATFAVTGADVVAEDVVPT
jgi:hypothetical protein